MNRLYDKEVSFVNVDIETLSETRLSEEDQVAYTFGTSDKDKKYLLLFPRRVKSVQDTANENFLRKLRKHKIVKAQNFAILFENL